MCGRFNSWLNAMRLAYKRLEDEYTRRLVYIGFVPERPSPCFTARMEWRAWCRDGHRPPNVPADPPRTYKHAGWQGWGHWLGTGNQHTKEFLPFGEALAVARSHGLASRSEWQAWCKAGCRPANVPARPDQTYEDAGWQGYGHWLGTGNTVGGNAQGGNHRVANTAAIAAGAAATTDPGRRAAPRKRTAADQASRGPHRKQQRSRD